MKFKYCLMGLLCLFLKAHAQPIKSLTISNTVPDVEIKTIFNYPTLSSNLSAFKSKLLILDFMATNCASCLEVLPLFDSLQKQYRDKIKIILVTSQSAEKVKSFLKMHPAMQLPIVGEDSLLSQYFPHTFISHEVWINKGVVKAITRTEYVNHKNIETVLANNIIHWPVKRDLAEFNFQNPLLHINEENPEQSYPEHIFYTAFSSNMPNVPHRFTTVTDTTNGIMRYSFINLPIIEMYVRSYGLYDLGQGNVVLEVKDSSRFIFDKEKTYLDAWRIDNTFCYEASLPLNTSDELRRQKMRSDLDLYFHLQGRFEKRMVKCMVLQQTDSMKPVSNIQKKGGREIPVVSVVYMLNHNFYGTPYVDESGLGKKVLYIDEKVFANIPLLQQELKKYGLQFLPAEREINMLVISDQ